MILTSLIIALYCLGYVVYRWGILPSFSASYYKLKEEGKDVYFFFAMIAFSTPLLLEAESLYMGLAVGSLWMVGAAGAYDDDRVVNVLHYTFAVSAVFWGMMHVWFDLNQPYMVVGFVVFAVLFALCGRKKIWWIEVGALVVIYFGFWLQ